MKAIKCNGVIALLAIGVFEIGCGTVSKGGGEAGGDFTLTATPTSLSVPIASSGTVTLSIDRTGSPGDVMLSAPNLPAGITVTFATNPVPAAGNASDVTIAVAPGTPAGTSNVTFVGSSGGVQKTVTVIVTAETITVAGTVRGARAGVMVRLVGKDAVTSAADGSFMFTDVTPPYDIYTIANSGIFTNPIKTVIYYKGLTRPDPVVNAASTFIPDIILPRRDSAALSGTVTPSSATTILLWDTGGEDDAATSPYSMTATWPATLGTPLKGTLYGFQFTTKPSGAPDVFTGYASSTQTLTSGTPATINLDMQPPQTAALTGTITSPSGFPAPSITLDQQLDTAGSFELWAATTTAAAATIPLVGAGKATLAASAVLGTATTQFVHPALAAATDVTFALPAPAVQTSPLDQATGITTTTPFSWTAAPSTVYQLNLSPASGATVLVAFELFTTDATATIPVVPEQTLPLNQTFNWNVDGYGPNATVDDAASANGLATVSEDDFTGDLHWFTNSTDRTFTSSP